MRIPYRQTPPPEGMIRVGTDCASVSRIKDGWILNRWTELRDGGILAWKPMIYPGRKKAVADAKRWCGL